MPQYGYCGANTPGFLYSKLFLFLSMYFYRFIGEVVADGWTVVMKPELRVGFLGLVAITQTGRERRQREQPPQQVRTFRIAIFLLWTYWFHLRAWWIPIMCAAIASTGLLFCFVFSPRFPEIRSFTSASEVFPPQREHSLVPVRPLQYSIRLIHRVIAFPPHAILFYWPVLRARWLTPRRAALKSSYSYTYILSERWPGSILTHAIFYKDWSGTSSNRTGPPKLVGSSHRHQAGRASLVLLSVRSRPGPPWGPAGGLPRAQDETGRQEVVRPRLSFLLVGQL